MGLRRVGGGAAPVDGGAVAAGPLGSVERRVGGLAALVPARGRLGEGGDADRASAPQALPGDVEGGLLELGADALGQEQRTGSVGLLADGHELFAAVACDGVGVAFGRLVDLRQALDHAVAGVMAV